MRSRELYLRLRFSKARAEKPANLPAPFWAGFDDIDGPISAVFDLKHCFVTRSSTELDGEAPCLLDFSGRLNGNENKQNYALRP